MKIQAPAKLNLTLNIIGKKPNGYHLVESDVVFLNLCDELEFEPSDKLQINSDIKDNLVIKAARALHQTKGARISLLKHIPMGAGLGGGSADAAATLFALNKMWKLFKSDEELYEIALKLGADVPVCLYGHINGTSSAHFEGVGEIISEYEAPDEFYLIINPNIHLATVDVFARLAGRNNLLEPAKEICPEISVILDFLKNTNCIKFGMSGSGSTCFASFVSKQMAEMARRNVPTKWSSWVATKHIFERQAALTL